MDGLLWTSHLPGNTRLCLRPRPLPCLPRGSTEQGLGSAVCALALG